jgi:hypothetical protein
MSTVPQSPSPAPQTEWKIHSPKLATRGSYTLTWSEKHVRYVLEDGGKSLGLIGSGSCGWTEVKEAITLADQHLDSEGWSWSPESGVWSFGTWSVFADGDEWKVKRDVDQKRATKAGFARADLARGFVERRLDRTTGPLRGQGWRSTTKSDAKIEVKMTTPEKAAVRKLSKHLKVPVSKLTRTLLREKAQACGIAWPK